MENKFKGKNKNENIIAIFVILFILILIAVWYFKPASSSSRDTSNINHHDKLCDNCGRKATHVINGWEYCEDDAIGFITYHYTNKD